MVKFENRVALMRLNHSIKTTSLIVFVELLATAKQHKNKALAETIKKYKKENKLKILKETRSLLKLLSLQIADFQSANKNGYPLGRPETPDIKKYFDCNQTKNKVRKAFKEKESQEDFVLKQIKNNYAKKILAEQSDLLLPKAQHFSYSNQSTFLSQGNNLVLFLNSNSLFLLENIEQNENISILGGIYKDRVLNHNQVSRLIKLSKNNQIYHNINFILKEKSLFGKTLSTQTPLCFFSFFLRNIYAKLCFTILFRIKKFNS